MKFEISQHMKKPICNMKFRTRSLIYKILSVDFIHVCEFTRRFIIIWVKPTSRLSFSSSKPKLISCKCDPQGNLKHFISSMHVKQILDKFHFMSFAFQWDFRLCYRKFCVFGISKINFYFCWTTLFLLPMAL